MANIVSIDWSVEEFRRLISEQPHSRDTDIRLDKTVHVLNFEVSPPSEPTNHVLPMDNANSHDVEAAIEGSLSLPPTEVAAPEKDSSPGWTAADVTAMAILLGERIEEPTSSPEADGARALDAALHVLNFEVAQPPQATDQVSTREGAGSSEIGIPAPGVRTEEEEASAAPIEPAAPKALNVPNRLMINPVAPPLLAEARTGEPRSLLEKAIAEPDVHASRADRDRAIDLRWVLRDIRSNRLKWSPPREHDLKVLIEFDLVEMRDGLPQLTNAGVSAVI